MKSASAWPAAFVCRLLFYVEYNKEPALSANNSSETSSSDTYDFSIISFIKNRRKSHPRECPEVLILYKQQACSPTVLAATARKICAQNSHAHWILARKITFHHHAKLALLHIISHNI